MSTTELKEELAEVPLETICSICGHTAKCDVVVKYNLIDIIGSSVVVMAIAMLMYFFVWVFGFGGGKYVLTLLIIIAMAMLYAYYAIVKPSKQVICDCKFCGNRSII